MKTTTYAVAIVFACLLAGYAFSHLGRGRDSRRAVVVFAADSLDLFFHRVEKVFEEKSPGFDLQLEPSGSVLAARKLSHGRACDLLAVADSRVIDELIPRYASWRIEFATNALVLAGTQMSRHINEISARNWFEILLKQDVRFGRADPALDPCGYWTLLSWRLADQASSPPGSERIYERLLAKSPPASRYVREDAQKLLALVEGTGGIDYAFVYRSQAVDHRLRFTDLPDDINLGNPAKKRQYGKVSIEVEGRDGRPRKITGHPILYSLTIPKPCRAPEGARQLVALILSEKGKELLEESGLSPLSPPAISDSSNEIRNYLMEHGAGGLQF